MAYSVLWRNQRIQQPLRLAVSEARRAFLKEQRCSARRKESSLPRRPLPRAGGNAGREHVDMASRPRMGSVYSRGRRWWIQYRHNGRTIRESSHSNLKVAAEDLLKTRLSQMLCGTFAGSKMERVTVGELLDDLEQDY